MGLPIRTRDSYKLAVKRASILEICVRSLQRCCRNYSPRTQSFPRSELLQHRFYRDEDHKIKRLGGGDARGRVAILQLLQSSELSNFGFPDMTFLTQRSDKFLAWSSPLRAFWALVSLEAILPPG